MIKLQNNIIKVCKYKLKKDNITRYDNELLEGWEVVEEYDTSNEQWIDGKYAETLEQAKEWLAMGESAFKKQMRDEIVRKKMAEWYPNLTDEIAILYRGTDEEKALHEQRYDEACAYADEVTL